MSYTINEDGTVTITATFPAISHLEISGVVYKMDWAKFAENSGEKLDGNVVEFSEHSILNRGRDGRGGKDVDEDEKNKRTRGKIIAIQNGELDRRGGGLDPVFKKLRELVSGVYKGKATDMGDMDAVRARIVDGLTAKVCRDKGYDATDQKLVTKVKSDAKLVAAAESELAKYEAKAVELVAAELEAVADVGDLDLDIDVS